MYQIQTLNEISPIIEKKLPASEFSIAKQQAAPQGILVRSANMHDTALADSLLAIARAGAGTNNIPVDACSKRGIVVFNTPGANANAVKELVVAALLLASRDVIGSIDWCRTLKGKGADVPALVEKGKNQFVGPEIKGKKLGVLGLGATGAMVANAGQALGMEVMGYDPWITVDHAWMLSRSIQRANDREAMLSQCDYISIHVPLMPDTRGLFSRDVLSKLKPGCALLNFSRAELVDTPAVLEALEKGTLRRYVTDFPTDDLIGATGVIAIPHLAASTPESEENCAEMAAEEICEYLKNGTIRNSVNFPDCDLARTDAHRVTVVHDNAPGLVGAITTKLADYKVNIASLINKSRNAIAYTVLDLDEQPCDAMLAEISALDGVIRARAIAGV